MSEALEISRLSFDDLVAREWLIANGVGGYASSTVPCTNTRKYHGLLVAAMASPVRRMVLLSRVEESFFHQGRRHDLASNQYPGTNYPQGYTLLRAFSVDPFPRWGYQAEGWTLEKQLRVPSGRNAVVLTYTLWNGEGGGALELRPLMAMRPIHELMFQWNGRLSAQKVSPIRYRIPPTHRTPEVFFSHHGEFDSHSLWYLNTIYRREQERGYAALEDLWSPGAVRFTLAPGQSVHFVCSADPMDVDEALRLLEFAPPAVPTGSPATPDPDLETLHRSARPFIVNAACEGPSGQATACVTDYPWGRPSGRDAMIAFTGLLLATGRFIEARSVLLAAAQNLRDGLLPSEYPEDGSEPLYRGADVSLWFVNAVWQYLRYTGDDATVKDHLLAPVFQILDAYRTGTRLGIAMDADGLISSRAPGLATSWMDAKLGDWVITARAGRPVELNALWYNALRIGAEVAERFESGPPGPASIAALASQVVAAFNSRFWNDPASCCFDVIDDRARDAAIRPNQLLAISLPFPILSLDRAPRMLETVRQELLTPVGLRTLSPRDPSYLGRYRGDVVSRDRAYHNGSVFPWLLGPYVSAYLKVNGRTENALAQVRQLLKGCLDRIRGDGLGNLCELFDGDPPHTADGAVASARSVGEVLRCYAEDVLDLRPGAQSKAAGAPSQLPIVIRE